MHVGDCLLWLSAASPQDVSKRPTMTNHAESQKARSATSFRRLSTTANQAAVVLGQLVRGLSPRNRVAIPALASRLFAAWSLVYGPGQRSM